ncbi:immunity 49 family protein [Undibacterium sp.]|uniref:immunity 49 family protein n=1 Tax=Undibacterium sp. TaxID=1914977 RepID=UPI00272F5329|nr:immunity 49 family protein [Undibacterium sp.]MDP1979216.1 immunity 49 family protein [Undibacterium sp.]
MQVERHSIDSAYMKGIVERANHAFEDLPQFVDGSRRTPRNLGTLANEAIAAAAFEHVIDPTSQRIAGALRLAAEARSALFATALNPQGPVVARLGEGEPVIYKSAPDESSVYIGAWLDGFFLNVICGDVDAIKLLCQVPNELFLRTSTRGSEYLYHYKDALCAYVNGTEGVVEGILAALRATDPDRPDIHDRSGTLLLDVPQLEIFMYLISENPKFEETLNLALEKHRDYWSSTQQSQRNFRGFISIPLTGLAALGRNRDIKFDVASPYLPMDLVLL